MPAPVATARTPVRAPPRRGHHPDGGGRAEAHAVGAGAQRPRDVGVAPAEHLARRRRGARCAEAHRHTGEERGDPACPSITRRILGRRRVHARVGAGRDLASPIGAAPVRTIVRPEAHAEAEAFDATEASFTGSRRAAVGLERAAVQIRHRIAEASRPEGAVAGLHALHPAAAAHPADQPFAALAVAGARRAHREARGAASDGHGEENRATPEENGGEEDSTDPDRSSEHAGGCTTLRCGARAPLRPRASVLHGTIFTPFQNATRPSMLFASAEAEG